MTSWDPTDAAPITAPQEVQVLPAVDAAYRSTYGHYPSIVDHLVEDGPRSATLQVHPA
ncbi:hypothetical protein [Oryzihumus sp.]|uniref:hypothetical protein n=1 Tax=Oryzihumus sp. TaxID=1968903 RepID=UPI002EDA2C50